MRKYQLTGEPQVINGGMSKVKRIQALIDIPETGVKVGDIGGWIEDERNLSDYGSCWVFDDAIIYGDARVMENAMVRGKAKIHGVRGVIIKGNAVVDGDSQIFDAVLIEGNATFTDSFAYGEPIISGNAQVSERSDVHGYAFIAGNARICGGAKIGGRAIICDDALIHKNAVFFENVRIDGETEIRGHAH